MLPVLVAAVTTTTNPDDVPRVVGDPLPWGIWFGSGLLLLAVILLAGWIVSRRMRAGER
jgi:hypothetical protein